MTQAADPQLVDGLYVVLMLGMALLMWRRFRSIRARMREEQRRKKMRENMRDEALPQD